VFYVRIDGVPDEMLGFLGYVLVAENPGHKLYRDYHGDEYVVDNIAPYLMVEDLNDAQILAQHSRRREIIEAPPRR